MSQEPTNNFLEEVRISELEKVEKLLLDIAPCGSRILEIGAGTGWQARRLSALGYEVSAIDIPASNHGKSRIWPIVDFDGVLIPYPDQSFDVVYSSNVLEHVKDSAALNREIIRVLRPKGFAIHYVPTSAWRMWSLAVFYPALFRELLRRLIGKLFRVGGIPATAGNAALVSSILGRSLLGKIIRRIFPHAHGEIGNCFTEILRFRKSEWDGFFLQSGWGILTYADNALFLTGDMILGSRLSIKYRKLLSKIFGCTAHLYVLKPMVKKT